MIDFGPIHKVKLIVQVLFESSKVEFSSQKAIVTGFERTRLPRTQQEDTLFTITR